MRRTLFRDTNGIASIEFAIVAPVMFMLIGGLLELGYVTFARSTLESAILDASRASRVTDCPNQNASLIADKLDDRLAIIPSADGNGPRLTVESYGDEFGNVGTPEPFTDDNGNDFYDVGETYDDVNGNGQWDADMGQAGNYGSFGDVVRFSAEFDVPSLFGFVAQAINDGQSFYTVSATTVVRNEPYRDADCS